MPWFALIGWPIYKPWAFFLWWFAYDAYAREIFVDGAYIAASGGIAAFTVAVTMSVWRAREARKVTTYGSARWADHHEIRRAGLFDPDGVVLGRWHGAYLRHDGPEHVLCFAPTRSGKGVGLVVPTLLTWPGSAIVHDIKGENWSLTAGWRARFGQVLLFDPTNAESAAYNPLLEVRRGDWEVRDVQNIADVLVDPEGALERRNHWEKTSHSLLVGAILHVLYAEPDKTLAGVANFLSDPRRPIEKTLDVMMRTAHLGEAGVHSVVASSARELLNKSDNERSGVLSTAMSFLGLYRDPIVAAVTCKCDWRIRDLVEGAAPATLYLVVPPSDISRTKPLVRLILNQIGRRLTEDLTARNRRERLLLLLDEFPALGRLDFFESALAFMAGYGLKAFLIAQSLNQIEKAYGQNNAILDNCQPPISTLNLAHLMPFSAVWAGPERDEHFQGPPLFFARTEGSTPFRFSIHVGDVGHTLIVGPTGAGKSVLLALMALQFRRYAGAQIFAFDFGGSIRAAALAMGGDWHDLGGAISDDAPDPVALQPLARIDDAGERAWAAEWVATLLARESVTVTPELKEHLWSALTSLASAPVSERTITGLSVLLQSGALKQALQPYTISGPWGRLLDAESERLGDAETQAFETEGLIGASAAPAVLSYLFHRIEDRFDGRSLNVQPTITIRPGFPVRVLVTHDLVLEPYRA